MDIEKIALILDTLGKVLVAWTAISVHHRVLQEHTIDNKVFRIMKTEQVLGIVGIFLIIVAFIIKIS